MKNITKRLLSASALLLLGVFAFSCSNKYGNASSSYFKKERKKYEVMDQHADCPQLVKSRR
ncbi:hypothetical protein KMW28_07810 [Flammeovirga yaeyamensis]|uniref:Lipoprotein n=1 Tax=Flammeovirga yaeyamensis TaxID=367791 RepID=A0AAX1N7K7_9BACT|nr:MULTISPECIES: hypothetical protein [Flammeovirga]ANQ49049.1 hypothetical protein MY04_1675 [Flammeovirga sp. MY04]MBB3699130.1 hypothetical protein [Flammeovirga yaeyamensis]NMF36563.1 hypothetical protein [Flammeovirga yaeyamensis]QWG03481.1 hypothetical protein KMW28_07810 [Flammeovirga yaeyamensis]